MSKYVLRSVLKSVVSRFFARHGWTLRANACNRISFSFDSMIGVLSVWANYHTCPKWSQSVSKLSWRSDDMMSDVLRACSTFQNARMVYSLARNLLFRAWMETCTKAFAAAEPTANHGVRLATKQMCSRQCFDTCCLRVSLVRIDSSSWSTASVGLWRNSVSCRSHLSTWLKWLASWRRLNATSPACSSKASIDSFWYSQWVAKKRKHHVHVLCSTIQRRTCICTLRGNHKNVSINNEKANSKVWSLWIYVCLSLGLFLAT